MLAADWPFMLLWFGVFLAALLLWTLGRGTLRWILLRRGGTSLGFRQYMSLRWQGVDIEAVAKAQQVALRIGRPASAGIWLGLKVLGVDVAKLADALEAAQQAGVQVTAGQLGVAALAGYDPAEVVQAALDRGIAQLTERHLAQLASWGLKRGDRQ
jgi:uncharacterized protein YqfA (UPF0365 family)